ncbi:HyaD/HybD family hydrogenase maturation endopeptidase [Telmatobacter bradus]|uniref:HyaD/HybD family hydrogenase maturation endopeptidase n=1 Tax=Telmatobacter bradus TaxID=474953 RepID=UPI003B43D643
MPSRVVVLGIGNTLMGDEGVGVHAIEALVQSYDLAEAVEVIDGGTAVMELLPDLENVDHLIVIDAVRCGQPPASVVCMVGDQVPVFFKTKLSPHQVGLCDVLAALRFKGAAPGRIVLIGVQPQSMELGMELSPEVQTALKKVLTLVVEELDTCGQSARLRS